MEITKAVIPVAGKGTRFLPATKEIPKEMIPILKVPMLHYVVDEAVRSGISQIILVTSSSKTSIENFYDQNQELESFLEEKEKTQELKMIRELSQMVEIISVRQKEQLGLGHAVLCSEKIMNKSETFAVLLGDDITQHQNTPVTKQLIETSQKYDSSPVIGVMEVPRQETFRYGIVDGEKIEGSTYKMAKMVEKPKPEKAPSCLATPGRYILNHEIFHELKNIKRGAGGEYQLTDAINALAQKRDVYAHIFAGERFDTGSLQGYLKATIEFALQDPELKGFLKNLMEEKVRSFSS